VREKLIFLPLIFLVFFLCANIAQAGPQVVLDGKTLTFDVPPTIENDRTLVPLRTIFEALGAKVNWDNTTRTVTASKENTEIKLTIGGQAYKNGRPVVLEVPAKIISDRTMVPLRFVSESLGCQVVWDDASQTVTITSSNGNSANTNESFSFDVLGDSKIIPGQEQWLGNQVLAKAVTRIKQENPALVVYLGDGIDSGGPIDNLKTFRAYLDNNLKVPWYPVIGNHELKCGAEPDGYGGDGEGNYKKIFVDKLPPNGVSYFSFNYQNAHFIILDTAWQTGKGPQDAELEPGSQQWEWLCRDLEQARQQSKHIFIFEHKPPVSPFQSGGPDTVTDLSNGYGSSWENGDAAVEFINLTVKYHVDAVFSGHIHMYNHLEIQGVPYYITAGAGASLYASPENGGYYHYIRCHVNGAKVSFEVVKL